MISFHFIRVLYDGKIYDKSGKNGHRSPAHRFTANSAIFVCAFIAIQLFPEDSTNTSLEKCIYLNFKDISIHFYSFIDQLYHRKQQAFVIVYEFGAIYIFHHNPSCTHKEITIRNLLNIIIFSRCVARIQLFRSKNKYFKSTMYYNCLFAFSTSAHNVKLR